MIRVRPTNSKLGATVLISPELNTGYQTFKTRLSYEK